ncbi:CPCC family cysteine-rich protein [Streptomyces sp. Tue6028]|uniref:CPCC family cysteine-rich protein n=1 Tax=Streptomyces sp. Tue6028 TaxID=2036037 RepID=UPI003EB7770A
MRSAVWEDDGQDEHDADEVRGGPNGSLSSTAARKIFRTVGACDPRFTQSVRDPLPKERPDSGQSYGTGIVKSAWERPGRAPVVPVRSERHRGATVAGGPHPPRT